MTRSMEQARDLMTTTAQKGATVALTFEAVMQRAFASYHVEVTKPEQSTSDGSRALQHIRLTPEQGLAIVAGELNVASKSASLRTLGHLQTIHRQRFGKDLAITAEEYAEFEKRAAKVFKEFGLTFGTSDPKLDSSEPKSEASVAPEEAPKASPMLFVAVGVVVLLLAVGAFFAMK